MRIGILSAIKEELKPFPNLKKLDSKVDGNTWFRMDHPKHQIWLCAGGLGKVNAAIASTVLIREHKIDFLLNTGIAGTLDPSLNLADVCYGKRLIQHDYGTLKEEQIEVYPAGSIPLGDSRESSFTPENWLVGLLEKKMPELRAVTLLSGDVFLQCHKTGDRLRKRFQAQLVDMESAAVAQAAAKFRIPFLAIRSVSDLVGEHPEGVPVSQLKQASRAAAASVMKVLEMLPSEIATETEVG